MKKTILGMLVVLSGLLHAQKKESLELGAYTGLPSGAASEVYSCTLGINVAYTFPVTDRLNLGLATGWGHFFSKKSVESNFFPVAGKVKYYLSSAPISFNLDIGAAIYSENKAGFYTFPKVGYHLNKHEIYLGYQNLNTQNRNFGSVNIGYNFNFK